MPENNQNPTPQTDPEPQEPDYVAAITELRANTVPKDQYARLKEENAQLLRSLLNGETIEASEAPAEPDISQLRKELFSGEETLTNLEYVTKALELRSAIIERGEPDPFLPVGHQISPTPADIEAANRVARVMQECVDNADGDSALFTSLLMRETMEAQTPPRPRK